MDLNQQRHLCQQGKSHKNKSIVMMCLDAKCQQRRLCCLVCIDQFHYKHQLISLDKFKETVEGSTQQIDPNLKSKIFETIKNLQSHLIKRVDQIIEKFISIAAKCKQEIKSAISGIQQSVSFNLSNKKQNDFLSNLGNDKVNQYLALINQTKTFSFKDIQNTILSAKYIFEKGVEQCEKYNIKAIQQLNRQIKKLKQLTKSRGILKSRSFSKIYKSADISLNETLNEAIRTVGTGGFPIILIQEPINEVNNTVNFLIKEQPGNKGLWMGVCVLNIVENHNFAGCYGIGKGTWAIDQVGAHTQSGFSWSHHDPDYNSKPKLGWKFQTADTVTIKVDFAKSTVKFTCGNNSFEMPIKLNIGDIYFFVGVTHPNDKICIMIATALLQVEGLPCRLIEELTYCDREQRVRGRFAGQVIKVNKDEKYTSFVVSDGSATAEATLLYKKIKSQQLLPKKGDSVHIIGHGYKKVFGGKNEYSFLKILVLSVNVITLEQQFQINLQAIKSQGQRIKEVNNIEQTQKLKPLYTRKSFDTVAQQQQVRTLIMIYCYYVFQHNSDIQSYIFNPEMIRCSKHGREFMEAFGITKDCLEQILRKTLIQLCIVGLVFEKLVMEKNGKEQFFLIKRDLFKGIQKTLEERVIEFGSKGGIGIDQINVFANKKISQFTNISYHIFNWKFIQKVLTKLQGINKIYKTSDKLIFPNIRI